MENKAKYHYEWGVYWHGSCIDTSREWHIAHYAMGLFERMGKTNLEMKKTRVYN